MFDRKINVSEAPSFLVVMEELVKIVDDVDFKFTAPIAVDGLPDVGLVGTIAAFHIVEQLDLQQVAHFESELFPPVMVLHKGILRNPVRIYGNESLIVFTSEIPLPMNIIYSTSHILAKWFKEKDVRLGISLSGIPMQNREQIKTPKVFSVANNSRSMDILIKHGIEIMNEGFIAGIYALILSELKKIGLPSLALLSQSFLKYPDPGASAAVIDAFNKIAGTKIDTEILISQGDEIRVKARDLMNQTQGSMSDMQKTVEQTIPMMYR